MPLKKKVVGMDMMEMTGPSKSERELKSMQSVGGSLIAENFRASSMMPKNLQGEGGELSCPHHLPCLFLHCNLQRQQIIQAKALHQLHECCGKVPRLHTR